MKHSYLAALVSPSPSSRAAAEAASHAVPPATSEVPASATRLRRFIEYLKLLVASAADMLEPVDTSAVLPQAATSTSRSSRLIARARRARTRRA